MEMKKYIEMGEKLAGKQIELAKILDVRDSYLRIVKSGRRGLSDDVCIRLADYIKVDRLEVIAASNLVTEKDEKKRKIFESCFKNASKAASIAIVCGVTFIMTPPSNSLNNMVEKTENLPFYKL